MAEVEMGSLLDAKITEFWDEIVQNTNLVLHHAQFYGFGLMHIPDPNVKHVARMLQAATPAFEQVLGDPELSAYGSLQMQRAQQVVLHLTSIALALIEDDEVKFDAALNALRDEAMF